MGVDVQAQGLKLKSKTLEDVLKTTFKAEPKLIGYDETPIDVTDTTTIGQEMVNGDLCDNSNPEIFRIREVSDAQSSCVKSVAQWLQSSPKEKLGETSRNRDCGSDSSKTGNIKKNRSSFAVPNIVVGTSVLLILTVISHYKGNARSRLYELCAAYCWKPPSFECCKEEGPAHLKL
jgi:endoribonuclease Dicer